MSHFLEKNMHAMFGSNPSQKHQMIFTTVFLCMSSQVGVLCSFFFLSYLKHRRNLRLQLSISSSSSASSMRPLSNSMILRCVAFVPFINCSNYWCVKSSPTPPSKYNFRYTCLWMSALRQNFHSRSVDITP